MPIKIFRINFDFDEEDNITAENIEKLLPQIKRYSILSPVTEIPIPIRKELAKLLREKYDNAYHIYFNWPNVSDFGWEAVATAVLAIFGVEEK